MVEKQKIQAKLTVKASGHTFDPTDVHIYEFLIKGTPNPLD